MFSCGFDWAMGPCDPFLEDGLPEGVYPREGGGAAPRPGRCLDLETLPGRCKVQVWYYKVEAGHQRRKASYRRGEAGSDTAEVPR
jgi:hypothetical protein